jgi:hypothetical protein
MNSPTEGDFAVIERELGGPIPLDYRNFILSQNGGIAADPGDKGFWYFNFIDVDNKHVPDQYDTITRFFSIGIGDDCGGYDDALSAFLSIRRDDPSYPMGLLPIAETSSSVIVGLSLGSDSGEVRLCPNGLAYCAGHIVLARSFTESLYFQSPDDE